ncbi:four helix bundle protein [Rhodopseudomonas palustris]|uniref:four helix bundle protein n=1 Tax=Rhodopseudomonas palustris TaxID=1076 RepID=UPI0021F3766E|nr:four helix bundle protein [Rhodopseudomonas palustris]UYO54600.1 four helix bundle protein [Rhodopseudomonas palustris]
MMTDNAKRTGPAVEAHYPFPAWLLPTIGRFAKSHRFTLGDRIENVALNVLEALIDAT